MEIRKRNWTYNGKRKSAWQMDYTHPATKKRVRETLQGCHSKAEAQAAAAMIYKATCLAAHTGQTESEVLAKYLTIEQLLTRHRARPGISAATRRIEKTQADRILEKIGGDALINDVSPAVLDTYAEARQSDTRGEHSLTVISGATILKELKLINQAIRWGQTRRIVTCDIIELPQIAVERRRPRCLTRDEIKQVFAELGDDDSYHRQAAEICYLAGLRRSELFRLAWQDVDLKRAQLTITTHKRGRSAQQHVDTVYLPDRAVALLKRRHKAKNKPAGSELVFGLPAYEWQGVKTHVDQNFGQAIESAARRAGIANHKQIGVHTLRHSCASHLLEKGASVPNTAAHLRHRDGGALLLKWYAHVHEDGLRKAGNLLT